MLSIPKVLQRPLEIIGATWVAVTALRVASQLVSLVRPRTRALKSLRSRYSAAGSWAIVTGGSDGIGKSLAVQLAECGFNVCVIARTVEKLNAVVKEVEKKGQLGIAIPFDFAAATHADYASLFAQLDSLDIAILVNNVGISHTDGELFEVPKVEDDIRLVTVNCVPMLEMCKYIIPRLKAKRNGAIVNLSSQSAVARAVPYLATYAGTKAFNRVFSESLTFELEPFGVDVLTVTPGFVSTNMTQGSASKRPRTNFMMVNVDDMARDTLSSLGKKRATSGHRYHVLQEALYGLLPQWLIGQQCFKQMKARSDYRKKKVEAGSTVEKNKTKSSA